MVAQKEGDEEGRFEIEEAAAQFAEPRTGPPGALTAADDDAAAIAAASGTWVQVTNLPYDSDDPDYRDPIISNSGAGSGNVTGRRRRLAIDGATVYAGGADGGVWRSDDGGDTWQPITDQLLSLSGALAVNPEDHSVWYGTGEANTAFDSYLGTGIYRSADDGETWRRSAAKQFVGRCVARIIFDGYGNVFAATSRGVRRSLDRAARDPWTVVPQPGTPGRTASDRERRPGRPTEGRTVVANVAWRGGQTSYNGFYVSTQGGAAWSMVAPTGSTPRQSAAELRVSARRPTVFAGREHQQLHLQPGVGVDGRVRVQLRRSCGPWKLKADLEAARELARHRAELGQGYAPGIQIWYNQFIGVEPTDPNHVYMGLEEVYETTDGGTSGRRSGRTGTSVFRAGRTTWTTARRRPTPTSTCSRSAPIRSGWATTAGSTAAILAKRARVGEPQRRPADAAVLLRRRGRGRRRPRLLGRPAGQRRLAAAARVRPPWSRRSAVTAAT